MEEYGKHAKEKLGGSVSFAVFLDRLHLDIFWTLRGR
jgi:hypothetical protein